MGASTPITGSSVAGLLEYATRELRAVGVDSPRLDAELLVGSAIGLDRAALYAHGDRVLNARERGAFEERLARRCRREPVAYILGRAAFRNLTLAVDRRVLIPRPETELLVEWALDHVRDLRSRGLDREIDIVDVGTGSGAIAIAVAQEAGDIPGAGVHVVATDVSIPALELARANARDAGVDVEFLGGDLLVPLAGRRVDAVLSNPPYVAREEAPGIMPEVVDYEPHVALFVPGHDPLEIVRRIATDSLDVFRPGGLLALEVGCGGAADAGRIMTESGYQRVVSRTDLQGIERAVGGFAPSETADP